MICPVVAYAPIAATKPIMAIQPLNFSASGVIVLRFVIGIELKETCRSKDARYYPASETVVNYGSEETHHRKATIDLFCVLPIVHDQLLNGELKYALLTV